MAERIKRASMQELAPVISELIADGKEVRITVVGRSMYPMLRGGMDSVIIKKKENPRKYDIPLYRRENGDYILHRIVKEKEGVFSCLGDGQMTVEAPVYKESVIGVVSGFYKKDKYISCDNPLYKFYSFIWVNFKFLRPVFCRINNMRRRKKK